MKPLLSLLAVLMAAAPAFAKEIPGLELKLHARKTFKASEGVSFTVAFHNKGAQDLLLNGGSMLGDACQSWDGLQAEVKDGKGTWEPLLITWHVGAVAGRIYPLPLPLYAGGTYELPVKALGGFAGGRQLARGTYEIRCVFHEHKPGSEDTSFMPFAADGEAVSNILKVEIAPDPPVHLKGWGFTGDPDGDCSFYLAKDSLSVHVPGRHTPHDLAAEMGVTNAPRVLQSVKGDFAVQVRVEGRFTPGSESTLPGRGGYNGAGLVLMLDEQNVVCLARAVFHHPGGEPRHYANFEMRAGGDLQRIGLSGDHPLAPDEPAFLRLERRGQTVLGAVSRDGLHWDALEPKELPANWPPELHVGVVAVSTSAEEFAPRFSRFQVLR